MVKNVYHEIRSRQSARGLESFHDFLVKGDDADACLAKIRYFFRNYQLLRYANVDVVDDAPLPASSPAFWDRLDESIARNRQRVRSLLAELKHEGIERLEDLAELHQGYLSNTLHTATHLLDGFFGIDSHFYNLIEETHWISDELRKKIESEPGSYMLVAVRGST